MLILWSGKKRSAPWVAANGNGPYRNRLENDNGRLIFLETKIYQNGRKVRLRIKAYLYEVFP